jgi:hypothetical protein
MPAHHPSFTKRPKSQFNLNNQSLTEGESGSGINLTRSFLLENRSEQDENFGSKMIRPTKSSDH